MMEWTVPRASYPCSNSLACTGQGVEKGLLLAGLALALLGGWAEFARAESPPAPSANPPFVLQEGGSEHQEARQLLHDRKWAEAAIVLRSILRKDPGAFTVRIDLARALAFTNRREEALSTLEQALNREKKGSRREELVRRIRVLSRMFFSNEAFQLYQDGHNLMTSGKYRAARERLEKALALEPDNVEALLRLGQCLVLEQDDDSAAERLKLARKLNPYEPEIRLWLGRAMHRRGELREAIEELRAAVKALPQSERSALWYAEALADSGQRNSAIQLLEDDLAKNPLHLSALIALARTRFAGAALTKDPQLLWLARKDLQVALSRLGDFFRAERAPHEGELGFEPALQPEELREEIQKLLAQLESRLPVSAS